MALLAARARILAGRHMEDASRLVAYSSDQVRAPREPLICLTVYRCLTNVLVNGHSPGVPCTVVSDLELQDSQAPDTAS